MISTATVSPVNLCTVFFTFPKPPLRGLILCGVWDTEFVVIEVRSASLDAEVVGKHVGSALLELDLLEILEPCEVVVEH